MKYYYFILFFDFSFIFLKIFYLRIKSDIRKNSKNFRISETPNIRVATDRLNTNTSKYSYIRSIFTPIYGYNLIFFI